MFAPYDFYILRAPKLPLSFVEELNAQVSTDQMAAYLGQLYDREDIREALFLASDSAFCEVVKWRSGKAEVKHKLLKTLYKYTIRMASRPTPYGLFAGILPGVISGNGNKTAMTLSNATHPTLRLDMQCLSRLSDVIAKDPLIRTRIKYIINSSLYRCGDSYRFFQHRNENGKRIHLLIALPITAPIEFVLNSAAKGISYSTLLKALIALGTTDNQAAQFLDRLINHQLLVSELEPNLTGKEYFSRLLEKTSEIDKENRFYPFLKEIDSRLRNGSSIIDSINRVSKIIAGLCSELPCRDIVQCDLLLEGKDSHLDKKSVDIIANQLDELRPLNTAQQPADLKQFIDSFVKRYEDREIPLLEALDPDIGIGYGQSPTDYRKSDELLCNLSFANSIPNEKENPRFYRDWLLEKYIDSVEKGIREIVLCEKDLQELKQPEVSDNLPPSTSYAIGNLLKKEKDNPGAGEFRFHLQGLVGSSAITLISRFGHLSDELLSKLKFMSKTEQETYPNAAVAEIVHLPDTRTGNILRRSYSRQYEIPLLCPTGDDVSAIYLTDILVSVKNERVILRSKTLGKEIIPRLTTAHNYQNGMHIYRFLGDLQYQDSRFRIKWDWGNLRNRPFLPRISYKNIILSRAMWNVEGTTENMRLLDTARIDDFLKTHKLPKQVVLAEGDNELIIDFGNPLAKSIFTDHLARGGVTVYESLYSHFNSSLTDIDDKHFANEIIIPFKSDRYKNTASLPGPIVTHPRFFPPGSDWLYLKIFCGLQQADTLLKNHVSNIISTLESKDLLDKWFFLRYNVNGHHIRLRMLKKNCANFSEITEIVYRKLSPLVTSDLISGYQFDTYVREIERYGSEYMDTTESLFHIDSKYVLDILKLRPDAVQRWLVAIHGITQLLDAAALPPEEKLAFCEKMRSAYFQEFSADKALDQELNRQFRARRQDIEQAFHSKPDLFHQYPFIENRALFLKQFFSGISMKDLVNLLPSYVHMYINRLFVSEQRLHELVSYHFLCKLYRIYMGKKKNNIGL